MSRKGTRRKHRWPRRHPGDPAGVARARAELEQSQARYDTTVRDVVTPIALMRSRNNVTGMIDRLMHDIRRREANGGAGG